MSGKASLRVVELLEKARIEGQWTQVSQLAEQLPKEYQVLRYISLGECMLEQKLQNSNYGESTALHIARDYINKALKIGEAKNDKHYKEALILLAKTNYIQGHFQDCLDTLEMVDMDNMWENMSLTFHVTRALADAYAYKGMAMEYLNQLQDDDSEHLSEVIRCYEAAGDIALELLNSISRSTVSLTISGVLEIALVRSVLLQMKYGMVEKGLERLRWIVQEADIVGSESLRITLIITLGQVLVQGITDDQWTAPTQHRDTVTRKQARNTPTMRRPYETHFTPCNRAEETLLATLISQALLYKEEYVCIEEDPTTFAQTKRQVHMILNMLVMLLSRFALFRPLSDAVEKFMRFSNDDPHIWQQFALSLVASEQYTRAAAILQKCLSQTTNTTLALTLAKVYVNRLGQYEDAIKICEKYLQACPTDPLRGRLWLMHGVAQGGLARSCHLIADQNIHNKRGLESLLQAYALDPLCPLTIYHLTLRLACVGEVKKSMRYANKALCSGGEIAVDSSHLLCLLLTAQKRMEEALSVAELTLFDHPDNLNLLITKVVLEGTVHGGQKALVTCKEVLLPLLEKYSSPGEIPAPYLPYCDQWNSGKFQVTQWSDRISTHTTASFSGSVVGTVAGAESVAESIDSCVGQDQSNWGYQAEVWFTIAEVFLGEDMIPDAQKCVDEIKLLFPLSHLVSYMQGLIKEKEGGSIEAEQQYINAITINPQHIPSLIALGRLQMESGKSLLAEHYLTEATKQSPSEYAAWHHLGCLYQRSGEHSKASEYFLTALRFEGASPIRPYHVLQWKIW